MSHLKDLMAELPASRRAKVEARARELIEIHKSSGNIFADLGLPDAEVHLRKSEVVSEIYRLAKQHKITDARVGELFGISAREVHDLFKGRFREYTLDRLTGFLKTIENRR